MLILALLCLNALAIGGDSSVQPTTRVRIHVVDSDGLPAPKAKVTAHLGWGHYASAEAASSWLLESDHWLSVRTLEGETDAAGEISFADVPIGSRLTVFASSQKLFGVVEGVGDLRVELQATATVRGKISTKNWQESYIKITAVGPRGYIGREVSPDRKGNFELAGVAAGEIEIQVKYFRWILARKLIKVKPGKKVASAGNIKVGDHFMSGADPMVDATKVILVDRNNKPVNGIRFPWSGLTFDGSIPSDENGEVILMGGGVAIGPPPYVFRLGLLGDRDQRYLGQLLKVKKRVAIVRVVSPLCKVTGSLQVGSEEFMHYRILGLTPGKAPRAWGGQVKNGRYELNIAPGRHIILIGTLDGRVRELPIEVPDDLVDWEFDLKLEG